MSMMTAVTKTFPVTMHYHKPGDTGDDWSQRVVSVTVYVDLEWLANDLGPRAFSSKRKRATMGSGHIIVEVAK